jgi:hypothetical protein
MFIKKDKELSFEYENKYPWMPPIIGTKSNIPDWYKNNLPNNTEIKSFPVISNIKACIPFLDSLTSGYVVPTPFDSAVKIDDEGFPRITWGEESIRYVEVRDGSEAPYLPTPHGYHSTRFVWNTMVSIKVPKGYSVLVTHPLNRFDLPFITLSGVVDADSIMHHGKIPFYLKEGFEGIIKAGTPMFQVLPFKREDWKSSVSEGLFEEGNKNSTRSAFSARGWYKNNNWHRKTYE